MSAAHRRRIRRAPWPRLPSLALALALVGCGFQLRGTAALPFDTLYVGGAGTELGAQLRRAIEASGRTRIPASPREAAAQLRVKSEEREKSILSLNAAGQVREHLLAYRVVFDVEDASGRVIVPDSRIALTRELPFSSSQVLARQAEEELLYRDMQREAVQQMLRRLSAARP